VRSGALFACTLACLETSIYWSGVFVGSQWIDRGPNSGDIVVKIAALIGAIAYELRYTLVANAAPGP